MHERRGPMLEDWDQVRSIALSPRGPVSTYNVMDMLHSSMDVMVMHVLGESITRTTHKVRSIKASTRRTIARNSADMRTDLRVRLCQRCLFMHPIHLCHVISAIAASSAGDVTSQLRRQTRRVCPRDPAAHRPLLPVRPVGACSRRRHQLSPVPAVTRACCHRSDS